MANELKVETGTASTLGSVIATVPAGATWTIIGLRIANKASQDCHISVQVNGTYVSGAQTPLPQHTAIDIMVGSKIVAKAGHEVVVTSCSDNVADVYISYLEQT